jgi:ribosomal protein S18 acetylase RimI-like enzyme
MRIEKFTFLENIDRLAKIIFMNFFELQNQPDIEFTVEDISSILNSPALLGWFLLDDEGKIIGYLIGSLKALGDGRHVYYISYFYIIKKYRGSGIGKKIILIAMDYINKINIKFILLISKINSPAYQLYMKLGFLPDPLIILRNDEYKLLVYYNNNF